MNDSPDMQIKSLLRTHADRFDTPEALRDSIVSQMRPPQNSVFNTVSSWFSAPIPRFAASFGMGAIVASLVTLQWANVQQEKETMLLAMVSDHARAIVTQNTIEVRSSDRHTVKPWLSSQLGYSPQVIDLAEQGFPLVGGRRGFIGGTPVAVAAYAYRQHEIDVYVLRPDLYRQLSAHLDAIDGFNAAAWKNGGLYYVAISDMNAKQLQVFGSVLENRQRTE